jgi:hypothetical protein
LRGPRMSATMNRIGLPRDVDSPHEIFDFAGTPRCAS